MQDQGNWNSDQLKLMLEPNPETRDAYQNGLKKKKKKFPLTWLCHVKAL